MLNRLKTYLSENRKDIFDCLYSVGTFAVLIGLMIVAKSFA